MSGVCARVEGWTENRGGGTKGDGGERNGRTVWGQRTACARRGIAVKRAAPTCGASGFIKAGLHADICAKHDPRWRAKHTEKSVPVRC